MNANIKRLFQVVQVAAVSLFLLVGPGCDSSDPETGGTDNYFTLNPYESQTRDPIQPGILTITPANATVTFIGQQVNFRVAEGTPPYTWSVAVPAAGSVSPLTGSQTLYTVLDVSPNSVIVHDAKGQSAVANINGAPVMMAVTPSTVTLENDEDLASFTVTGGTAPFSWTVSDARLGQMLNPPADSAVEVYKRLAPGDNSITIEDSLGNTAIAVIKQPL